MRRKQCQTLGKSIVGLSPASFPLASLARAALYAFCFCAPESSPRGFLPGALRVCLFLVLAFPLGLLGLAFFGGFDALCWLGLIFFFALGRGSSYRSRARFLRS